MPKEPRPKNKEWEKERRNRLNDAFNELMKQLPCYTPSVNLSKIDILKRATVFIEELQKKVKVFLEEKDSEGIEKIKGEENKKLYERIKQLLLKNEQLCNLLREAKITIPTGCCFVKKINNRFLFSNKPIPDKVLVAKKEKENGGNKSRKLRKKIIGTNSTPKHRTAIKKTKKKKAKVPSKCVLVLSQNNHTTPPCYVITNAPSNVLGTSTMITNSGLVTNPVVSAKTATKNLSSITALGPGTLILANGTIIPAVQPLPQIITRPPIILVPKNTTTSVSTTGTKTLTRIKPKFCLTKTTQVNKVPIPALTSRYSNSDVVLKKSKNKEIKANKTEKKVSPEPEKKLEEVGEKRKVPTPNNGTTETKKAKVVEEKVRPKTPEKKDKEPIELNDIFESLQVPPGCQNPESTSPTAAFLLAFPLVSSGVKVTEVTEEDNGDSQRGTPNLLQIGTMEAPKTTQSETLNLEHLFSKDINDSFYCKEKEKTKVVPQEKVPCFDSFNYKSIDTKSVNFNEAPTTIISNTSGTFNEVPAKPLYTNSTTTYGDFNNKNYFNYDYEYRKNDNYFTSNYYSTASTNVKKSSLQSRPVNWMTDNSDYYNNQYYQNENNENHLGLVPPAVTTYRNDVDENQFSWSPTKIPQFLEPPPFVTSTLPTLVGDLSLNFGDKCLKKDSRKVKYDNQSNFSVSQLVDINKEVVPARTSTRRDSGGRNSTTKKVRKDCDSKNRIKNSYSAEALIGTQSRTNKSMVSSFLHDNIMPYFPPVDLNQDNFMQQNNSYSNTFIPTTTNYNFMHEVPPHDYTTDNLFAQKNKSVRNSCANSKKPKRKQTDLPNFDLPFLSMNSPILSDDFHSHGFLQPTPQLYPCKNPFSKPNELLPRIQHPEISPSINAGTSLTNFNLSTIFPEINKSDPFDSRAGNKDAPRSVQVPFNEKPTFNFGY